MTGVALRPVSQSDPGVGTRPTSGTTTTHTGERPSTALAPGVGRRPITSGGSAHIGMRPTNSSTPPDPFASFVAGAFAAWSSRVVNPAFAGTPMPVTGGNVTGYNDQIGTNNLTAVGTPTVNTNGINTNQFANLNGSSQYFTTGSPINLTTGTIACAWGIDASVSNQAMYGRQVNNATFIRYGSATSNTMIFKNEALTIATLNLPRKLYTSFMCFVFIFDGTNVTVICNGENLGSVAIGGTFLINGLARNQASNFVKGGHGESIISTQIVTAAQAIAISNSMAAGLSGANGWRSGSYYDATLGNDANYGWNAAEAKQTLATTRTNLWRPGADGFITGTYRNDPIFIGVTGQAGTAADQVTFTGTSCLLLGSINVSLAAATLVTGTEYRLAGQTAPTSTDALYYIDGTDPTDDSKIIELVRGTFGLLTFTPAAGGMPAMGQFAYSGTNLDINVGKDPTAGSLEIPQDNLTTDNSGVRLTMTGFKVDGINCRFWQSDGYRPSGADCTMVNADVGWNNNDGIGPTGAMRLVLDNIYSHHNGDQIATSASAGDGFSCHGGLVFANNIRTAFNNKAGRDQVLGAVVTDTNGTSYGDNQPFLCPDDGPSTLVLSNVTFTRLPSNVLNIFSVQDTLASTTINATNITLVDAESNPLSIGVYSSILSKASLTMTHLVTTNVGTPTQWNGSGTFQNNP